MHQAQLLFLVSFFAVNIAAVPLNINLGAYSPALVVGDGEISFAGKADVASLMNALEGAAVSGAATAAAAPAAPAPAAVAPTASAAASQAAEAPPASNDASIVPNEGTQITALQGMGKEIAPRVVSFVKTPQAKEKRDINGFNAALKYAVDALKTSPKVQLGTGAEGSGVGILQDAGISAPAVAAQPAATVSKRGQIGEKKLRTTVTTMFVRGGAAPAPETQSVENNLAAPVEKRAPSRGLDGVNLSMAEGQVAELTFVETRAVGDDDE